MEETNKEFVEKNLSNKSSLYIINDLFEKTARIESDMISINDDHKEKIFTVAQFSQKEFELYIIKESLLRRIRGTRERISGLYVDHQSDEDIMKLSQERSDRLIELESDWKKIRCHLYTLIETNHQLEVSNVLKANLELLKRRFSWSSYNATSGYEFVFFKEGQIGIMNHFAIGGD